MRRSGRKRLDALADLAAKYPLYVPALYDTVVDPVTGLECVGGPVDPRAPAMVRRGVVENIDDYPFPTDFPVPYAEAVFDRAAVEIARSVAENHPGVTVARLLVQPMVQGLQEVLLGYRRDPQVGPVVTLAPGGVLVGLYNDKAVRLAPVDEATAAEMIEEVVGLAPLRGYRGMPKGDLAALARAVAAFSRLAEHRDVLEADANPVLVLRDGVVTIDALIVKEE